MTTTTSNPPLRIFDGEGKAIRRTRAENIYGHVCVRMTLMAQSPGITEPAIAFTLSERSIPKNEWATIERAIQMWCTNHVKNTRGWKIGVEVFDGSWEAGAAPAYDRAAAFAMNDAAKKAIKAGLLSNEA